MKLNIKTQSEKQNFIGLLVAGNFLGATTIFILLLLQFWYFPQYFGLTWTFTLAIIITIAFFNLKYLRSHYRPKYLWEWLKNHQ